MGKILTHDSIAQGCWNRAYCSASPTQASWDSFLVNSPDILNLAIERMSNDYASLNAKMHKAYGAKDIDASSLMSNVFFAKYLFPQSIVVMLKLKYY